MGMQIPTAVNAYLFPNYLTTKALQEDLDPALNRRRVPLSVTDNQSPSSNVKGN